MISASQPYANHNGGGLAFGPDGYLYIGLGDGGSGGDPQGNAQSLETHLGKLLRMPNGSLQFQVLFNGVDTRIRSFGQDSSGEIYFMSLRSGEILRLGRK